MWSFQEIKPGDRLKHVTTETELIVYHIFESEVIAIGSLIIQAIDLDEYVKFDHRKQKLKSLTSTSYNSLQIGDIIRKHDAANAFIISEISNDVIFANRVMRLSNPSEWEKL